LFPVLCFVYVVGCSGRKDRPAQGDDSRATSDQAVAGKTKPPLNIFAKPAFAQATQGVREVTLSDIAERAVRSVVNISSTRLINQQQPYHDHPFFQGRRPPLQRRAQGLGSGVIVSSDGIVMTNNHVIAKATAIKVILHDGREYDAKLVGTDPKSDLAVLRLQGKLENLEPLAFGRSEKVRLGEVVLAIGNPFGVGQTVTMGIVSATGRANVGIVDYEDFIQTDAAINPGNSGGALVNLRAELIGINTAILSKSGGYQGIGFAVPSAMAQPIMESLLRHGRVVRGWLGVVLQDLNRDLARALRLAVERGVLVTDVQPESPAAKSGLRRGDVILGIDRQGKKALSVSRLRSTIASRGANAKVKLSVVRAGKAVEVDVVLGELPDQVAHLSRSQGALGGLTIKTLSDELRDQLRLPPDAKGVIVEKIETGSAAASAGLQAGDLILELNRRPIKDTLEFSTIYRQASGKILLLVYREGTTLYLLLEK
jgi:serine protease Do